MGDKVQAASGGSDARTLAREGVGRAPRRRYFEGLTTEVVTKPCEVRAETVTTRRGLAGEEWAS